MTTALITPEQEIFPGRKRWTREEYEALAARGQLVGHYELIDGEILSKMGQKPPHRITLNLIANWLSILFGNLYVQTQEPITIPGEEGETNEPEPDVAVTNAPTTAYAIRHPAPEDLLLVVEVSDTTRRFDLTTKALLYARAGVPEYWVMDVVQRQLHIHRATTTDGYTDVTTFAEDATVFLTARPEATVRVGSLLPPQEVMPENSYRSER